MRKTIALIQFHSTSDISRKRFSQLPPEPVKVVLRYVAGSLTGLIKKDNPQLPWIKGNSSYVVQSGNIQSNLKIITEEYLG